MVPWVGLQSVIVAFHSHTHLLLDHSISRIKSFMVYKNGRVKSRQIACVHKDSLILVITRIFSYQLVSACESFVTDPEQRAEKARHRP